EKAADQEQDDDEDDQSRDQEELRDESTGRGLNRRQIGRRRRRKAHGFILSPTATKPRDKRSVRWDRFNPGNAALIPWLLSPGFRWQIEAASPTMARCRSRSNNPPTASRRAISSGPRRRRRSR